MKDPRSKPKRYQDFVIRDGRFVGEFEDMYRACADPWHQMAELPFMSDKAASISLLRRLGGVFGANRVVEIGCGLGGLTQLVANEGFEAIGLDVSETAVEGAQERFPGVDFRLGGVEDENLLRNLKPDVILMADVTWYILDHLKHFLEFLRTDLNSVFLLHNLQTYPTGVQTYGREYFTDLKGMMEYFDMHYLEWGEVTRADGYGRAFFLASHEPSYIEKWCGNADD